MMVWWHWVLFGVALLVLELFLPSGFFIFFFGVGALVTGGVVALGFLEDPSLKWAFCTGLSIVLALTCRRFLMGKFNSPASFNASPEGREIVVTEEATPGNNGACEYRGSRWTIRNIGEESLSKGDRAVVERREGFTLLVRKIKPV